MSDKEPSAIVIPFGKHKGATVAELLEQDPAYAQWLLGQGWLAERFAELHAAIVARGAGTDDTPEHNAIQARFLDPVFRAAFLQCIAGAERLSSARKDYAARYRENASDWIKMHRGDLEQVRYRSQWDKGFDNQTKEAQLVALIQAQQRKLDEPTLLALNTGAAFEQSGVDVAMTWDFTATEGEQKYDRRFYSETATFVEIKPSLGDDFPSVMRQMARLRASVLVVGSYAGRAVSFPDLRKMFSANGIKVVTVQEIEAEIAGARALVRLQKV